MKAIRSNQPNNLRAIQAVLMILLVLLFAGPASMSGQTVTTTVALKNSPLTLAVNPATNKIYSRQR